MWEIPESFETKAVYQELLEPVRLWDFPWRWKLKIFICASQSWRYQRLTSPSVSVTGAWKGSFVLLKTLVSMLKVKGFSHFFLDVVFLKKYFCCFPSLIGKGSLNLNRMTLFYQLLYLMYIWISYRNLFNNTKIYELILAKKPAWRNKKWVLLLPTLLRLQSVSSATGVQCHPSCKGNCGKKIIFKNHALQVQLLLLMVGYIPRKYLKLSDLQDS